MAALRTDEHALAMRWRAALLLGAAATAVDIAPDLCVVGCVERRARARTPPALRWCV
jgi:hypothetical protein